MNETQLPTDAELAAFAVEEEFLLFCSVEEFLQIARAVLAKWGTPQPARAQAVAAPSKEYAELLNEHETWVRGSNGKDARIFTENQMRAFADATHALRIQQPATTPQADSQPAPANTRQIAECYGDCPEDPKTCANPCKFEGRAARAQADSVLEDAVDDDVDAIALARYKVVPAHESMFHRFAVVAGGGKQQLYLGREVECENMARKFAGAFLDGAFYQSNIAPAQTADSVLEDAARLDWLEQHDGRYFNIDRVASVVGTGFLTESQGNMLQKHSTLREAIDAAIAQQKAGE